MNKTAPYEKIIAKKLNELQVPDMADSIWARIETELDASVQQDDAGKEQASKPGAGRNFSAQRIAMLVTVAAVCISAVLLFNKLRKKTVPVEAPVELPVPQNNNLPQEDTGNVIIIPGSNKEVSLPTLFVVEDSSAAIIQAPAFTNDSLAKTSVRLPEIDAVVELPPAPVLVQPTLPVAPKGIGQKGVKDISPGDFRIKGNKNDSSRNQ